MSRTTLKIVLASALIALVVMVSGCSTGDVMKKDVMIQAGDRVEVDYVGTLDDGSVFDTSMKEEADRAGLSQRPSYAPLGFQAGAGQMIKGFDDAVIGMAVGEEKSVRIPPEQAYGVQDPGLMVEVPLEEFTKAGISPKQGMSVQANGVPLKVVSVGEASVKLDGNHPLAGKTLNFRIIVRKIEKQ